MRHVSISDGHVVHLGGLFAPCVPSVGTHGTVARPYRDKQMTPRQTDEANQAISVPEIIPVPIKEYLPARQAFVQVPVPIKLHFSAREEGAAYIRGW